MDRDELLNKLSNYKSVPGHGPDFNEMTDEELEKILEFFQMVFKDSFEEDNKVNRTLIK
ncbi:hypothetical protein U732_13 [Clostridium argentinense CDC 2741]|uniref:Uncharacterized protein n=2 Tax=Clostridium argentinense TaxID=29341 RepID=A0A0C1TZ47_9CLOT|nr:hypothetical protein [Clostridium argentinense]KIE44518.1 hypothetical protein U732_13 [Clostridium argentinense CDC 2741]BBB39334.1 hypothetical protein [Clostridium argentinense]